MGVLTVSTRSNSPPKALWAILTAVGMSPSAQNVWSSMAPPCSKPRSANPSRSPRVVSSRVTLEAHFSSATRTRSPARTFRCSAVAGSPASPERPSRPIQSETKSIPLATTMSAMPRERCFTVFHIAFPPFSPPWSGPGFPTGFRELPPERHTAFRQDTTLSAERPWEGSSFSGNFRKTRLGKGFHLSSLRHSTVIPGGKW